MFLAPALAVYAFLVHRFWFVCDDAYVSFRYARNLALGEGLRYNPGSSIPVEGYSNFLWVVTATPFELLGLDVTTWIPLVSTACGGLLLWRVFAWLQGEGGVSREIAGVTVFALAAFPPFAVWSSSGLEVLPFSLLLFLLFEQLLAREIHVGRAVLLAVGVSLIRTEGLLWVGVVLGVAVVAQLLESRRDVARLALVAAGVLAVGLAYHTWRIVYFEAWLPNTVHAKMGLPAGLLQRGVDYVGSYFLTFLSPLVPLAVSPVALRRARRPVGVAVAALAWAFPAYAVAVTGDFMAMGRLLVPGLAFSAVLLAWALQDLAALGIVWRRVGYALAGVSTAVGLLPAWDVHVVPEAIRSRFHFRLMHAEPRSEFEMWRRMRANETPRVTLGRALRAYAAELPEERPSLVFIAIGAVGYYSDLVIHDRAGLVSREVARRPVDPARPPSSPGHDRVVDPDFFLDAKPTLLDAALLQDEDPRQVVGQIEAAGAFLRTWLPERNLPRHYVPDFRVLAIGEPDEHTTLLVWRRIEQGEDWQAAWRDYETRLKRLAAAHGI